MPHNPPSDVDVNDVMNYITLTQTLVDSFNALASEVQSLTDRKTVLEHKLRFAHEQVRTSDVFLLSSFAFDCTFESRTVGAGERVDATTRFCLPCRRFSFPWTTLHDEQF